MKRTILVCMLFFLFACASELPGDKQFDLILTGGRVVDGLGNSTFRADIGVKGDRIVAVSQVGLRNEEAQDVLSIAASRSYAQISDERQQNY